MPEPIAKPETAFAFTGASPLRLGTRQSPLALAQAEMAADAIRCAHDLPVDAVRLVPMVASGDRIQDRALKDVGGKALWTKELDRALFEDEIDAAVHSMKDVETIRPAELAIIAMLPRADVRDRIIGCESPTALPTGARVGTSSPRRAAQLLNLRPDIEILLFRGNVATRLAKLAAREADATLLAAAGLDRLGQGDTGHAIDISVMLPAPAQGAIGIEALAARKDVAALLEPVNDLATHRCVLAERAFLYRLGADCHSPVAALARANGEQILLTAQLLATDGSEKVSDSLAFAADDGDAPALLAERLLDRASPALRALFAG